MLNNIYQTGEDVILTRSTKGRAHFAYRQPVKSRKVYPYELSRGENFHSLAAVAFSDDAFWWVLADLNKPVDSFLLTTGDRILLPESIVREDRGLKKFF